MKIAKITIDNFRNLKHFEIDTKDGATVISGINELGKSNALNAIVWFFTNTIYTDNSGVGENDINSICPKNQVKGEHTSVSITFYDYENNEEGPTFTKVYKTEYSRDSKKANGHHTEYLVNAVKKDKEALWTSELYKVIGYNPVFTSVKELNLFVDPLYALQKLNAKQLRTLLVSFGCTATNEELFKMGFDDLRPYEKKYLGDFVNMRLDLKKQAKTIQDSVKRTEILMEQFNSIEEFDNSKLDEINSIIDNLVMEKAKIENGGNSEAVKAYEYKLKELSLKLHAEFDKKVSEIKLSIKELEGKKDLAMEAIRNKKAQESLELRNEINRINADIASARTSIAAYTNSISTLRSNLNTTQTAAKNIVAKKTDYQAKLIATQQRVFTGYMVCPCCGASFSPDEDAERQFNEHKQKDIQFYTDQIYQFNLDIEKYQSECKEIVNNANNTKAEIAKLENSIAELERALENNKSLVEVINNKPVDMSSIDLLDAQIAALRNDLNSMHLDDSQLLEMQAKINALKADGESAIQSQLLEINTKIEDAESKREDLYIERSNWNQKLEYQKQYKTIMAQWNDIEALIERVNEFIHTMIQVINDKAKAKTGMDFVMLEENLGNDGVQEVCYAVVDGVPFAMINTAKKYECGIRFIEKVKDIAVNDFGLPRNDLPILADKFEGIDKLEKIKTMTTEQLICTRVGLESTITIL